MKKTTMLMLSGLFSVVSKTALAGQGGDNTHCHCQSAAVAAAVAASCTPWLLQIGGQQQQQQPEAAAATQISN
jgi:hypothetical protein